MDGAIHFPQSISCETLFWPKLYLLCGNYDYLTLWELERASIAAFAAACFESTT